MTDFEQTVIESSFTFLEWQYGLQTQWKMLYGNINSLKLVWNVLLALPCPWYFLGKIVIRNKNIRRNSKKIFTYLKFAIPFYLWIASVLTKIKFNNIDNIGWGFLTGLIIYASLLRSDVRRK